MANLSILEAVNLALHHEMERDSRVLVMGEDVGKSGGVFRATDGLYKRYGEARVVDTPLSESGIVGTAVGLCLTGMRPICEMQFESFSYPALDQMISHMARYRWRSLGQLGMSMVLRMPYGGGVKAPELHEESPETYYCHTPGLRVVVPSTPADARGLLSSAIRNNDPVVFMEPKKIYHAVKGEVPEGDHLTPLDTARIVKKGKDLTIYAWGAMIPVAEQAMARLEAEGVSVYLVDVRSLSPLDEATLCEAARATGRALIVQEAQRAVSVSSEIAALFAEKCIYDLKGPVLRATGYNVPFPFWRAEEFQRPSVDRIVATARIALSS